MFQTAHKHFQTITTTQLIRQHNSVQGGWTLIPKEKVDWVKKMSLILFDSPFMPWRVPRGQSTLKVSVKAAAETRHLLASHSLFYCSTCSVSQFGTQHNLSSPSSACLLRYKTLPRRRTHGGNWRFSVTVCLHGCACGYLGHPDWAGINLCDALVGFVSSLPHPIILSGRKRRKIQFRFCRLECLVF